MLIKVVANYNFQTVNSKLNIYIHCKNKNIILEFEQKFHVKQVVKQLNYRMFNIDILGNVYRLEKKK